MELAATHEMNRISDPKEFAIAIDIGGTKVDVGVIDISGTRLLQPEIIDVPFNESGVADPKKLVDLVEPLVLKAGEIPGELKGIGLSCCGNIDQETGNAVLVANLHWKNIPIGEMFKNAYNLPVFAATDVRMAAIGELVWGAAKNCSNFAWATIGTGYGGYLFLSGNLYDGYHGFAGNFGHITLDEINGYPCGCGRKGCFETFVAGPAIARAGQNAADSYESEFLKEISTSRKITTRDVFRGETAGDLVCNRILEDVIRLVSINLGGVVNTLDLEMLILGGGVAKASPDFISRIDKRIRDYLMTDEAKRDLVVTKESFTNSALFGAASDVFLRQGILEI